MLLVLELLIYTNICITYSLFKNAYFHCRIVRGGNNLCDGEVSDNNKALVVKRINDWGFGNKKQVVFLSYGYMNLGGLTKF